MKEPQQLDTGRVRLGSGEDADGTLRGIAVNIAAGKEKTVPPRALRISQDTCSHGRRVFDVEPQERLQAFASADAGLRRGFLGDIPFHHGIVAAWAAPREHATR